MICFPSDFNCLELCHDGQSDEGLFLMTSKFCYLVNVFHNNNDNLDEDKVHLDC